MNDDLTYVIGRIRDHYTLEGSSNYNLSISILKCF